MVTVTLNAAPNLFNSSVVQHLGSLLFSAILNYAVVIFVAKTCTLRIIPINVISNSKSTVICKFLIHYIKLPLRKDKVLVSLILL